MKAKLFIIGLFLFVLVACTPIKVPEPAVAEHGRSVEGPTPELSAIDSLLWHQPDSALTYLSDLDYCCLYLLGLTDADIAALMQKAYSTVSDRSRKLKAFFDKDEPLSTSICSFAYETIQN